MEFLASFFPGIDWPYWLSYWFMFPIAVVVAILANSSGFSGGVLFQPLYNIFMHIPVQNSVATGIATETVGMLSGAIRYFMQDKIERAVGVILVMLVIPGVVVGQHILTIIHPDLLRFLLGIVILILAFMQLVSVARNRYGKRKDIPVEDVYPFMWAPVLGGFFSATTGTGMCEISQPLLERGLDVQTKRANATAIWIEAMGDIIITILNLQAGMILWNILMFSGPGVIIGGQIGPVVAKYLPEKALKIIFSLAVIVIGCFYVYKGIVYIFGL